MLDDVRAPDRSEGIFTTTEEQEHFMERGRHSLTTTNNKMGISEVGKGLT